MSSIRFALRDNLFFWAILLLLLVATLLINFKLTALTSTPVVGLFLPIGILLVLIASIRPRWIVYFLAVFLPFETWFIGLLPISDIAKLAASFASEMVLYITFAVVALKRLLVGKLLNGSPVDKVLLPCIAVTIIALLANNLTSGEWLGGLINIRALFRYVVLYYLIINIPFGPKNIRRLFNLILLVGAANVALGFLQLGVGGVFRELFTPAVIEAEIANHTSNSILATRGREIGAIFGALGDTLTFGLFLVICLAIYLSKIRRWGFATLIPAALLVIAVGLSYSRAALLCLAIVGVTIYYWRFNLVRSILLTLVGLILLGGFAIFIVNPAAEYQNARFTNQSVVDNIAGVFTQDYIESAKNQRLGHLLGTVPTILANQPWLGYGPNTEAAIDGINQSPISYLYFEVRSKGFEDVYWMAVLAYYGIFGLLLFALLHITILYHAQRVYRNARLPTTKTLALIVGALVIATIFLNFFNQVLEIRIYSFYFWLFLGLMFHSYKSEQPLNIIPVAAGRP